MEVSYLPPGTVVRRPTVLVHLTLDEAETLTDVLGFACVQAEEVMAAADAPLVILDPDVALANIRDRVLLENCGTTAERLMHALIQQLP
jgi:hypothetical protein